MNLIILLAQDYITDNLVKLSDERFLQIKNIHQSTIGDNVKVGQLNGLIGQAIITYIDDKQVELRVLLNQPPPKKLPLTLVLALPRPKMIRRIFRSVTELGIERLIIINSYKVEKSFWKSPALDTENIEKYLIAGLQQAKDTVIPPVSFARLFKPFVEDQLSNIIAGKRAFIAHPGTAIACPTNITENAVLAVGPEGGFSQYEVEKFNEIGFESIHLGPRILRVENAITALSSKLYQF